MLFWTNFVWSDCVTASTQQRWKWKTSPFTSVSPGHLFPLWAWWHCLVILEVKALLLCHSSPPVPFNPIAPVLFIHSWTIHLLLYHSIPSLLYQFRRIVLQRSRTGCNVSAGFKLWVAAENSSIVSLDTGQNTAQCPGHCCVLCRDTEGLVSSMDTATKRRQGHCTAPGFSKISHRCK